MNRFGLMAAVLLGAAIPVSCIPIEVARIAPISASSTSQWR
jgi:hypothetical protein